MSRHLSPERFKRRLAVLGWREAPFVCVDGFNWFMHDHPELAGCEVPVRADLPPAEQLATLARLLQEARARQRGGRFLRKACTPRRDFDLAAETFDGEEARAS